MPNGGSDCCGTCWWNRTNLGQRDPQNADRSVEPFCEIRDLAIRDPLDEYCANHPRLRPDGDSIPIGPIFRGWGSSLFETYRYPWRPSPDTEPIRLHLLDLLHDMPLNGPRLERCGFPPGPPLILIVIEQLGDFREQRATPDLEWIVANPPKSYFALRAREALEKIEADP